MEFRRAKNTDTRVTFPIMKNDGTFITSAAGLDSEFALLGAHGGSAPSFSDCTHEATEIGSTGVYYLDVSAAELNDDYAIIQVKSSTSGAVTQILLFNTTSQQADLTKLLGTAPTEGGAGRLAAGLTKLFDVASPVLTAASVNQTGDAFARTGAPVGASISADIAATKALLPTALVGGKMDAHVNDVAANAITAASIAADADTEIAASVWGAARATYVGAGTFGEGVASVQGNVTGSTASIATNGINAASLAVGAIEADAFAAGAINAAAIADGAIDAGAISDNAIDSSALAADVTARIAASVWDALRASHTTVDTFGDVETSADISDAVWDELFAGHAGGTTFGGAVAALGSGVSGLGSTTSAIKVKTDYLPSATAGATGGVAIVGSVMGKSPATLATADVTGNLPADLKAVTAGVDFSATMKTALNAATPASVVGAVGSIASGGIASASFATGAITAGAIAADAIGASELAADGVAEIMTAVLNEALSGHTTAGTVGKALNDVAALGTPPSAGAIADAVCDEALSGHATSGTVGAALSAASAAGDPWTAVTSDVPATYGAGTFGKLVVDNLNAPVATVDTVVDAIKTVVDNLHDTDLPAVKVDTAAILVDTGTTLDGRIPAALVSGRMDVSVGAMAANVITDAAINADAITAAKIANGAIDLATFAADVKTGSALKANVETVTADAITAAAIAAGAIDFATFAADCKTGAGLKANVESITAGAITAASIAADAITDAKVASDVTIASVTGAVGSVTGNVGGNVSGNVGGNVLGTVASVVGNVAGTVGSLATQAKADVAAEVTTAITTVASNVAAVKAVTDNVAGMYETDGAVKRFTTNALENAPAGVGGSGDWTTSEKEQIRDAIGIAGDKTAAEGGQLQRKLGTGEFLALK